MTEDIWKPNTNAIRGYVIHTRSWDAIIAFYRESAGREFEPLLKLVEGIASSSGASQLFAATSMQTLLISDVPNFRLGDSTLLVSYLPSKQQFHFRHTSFSGDDDEKTCVEPAAMQTLTLFVKYKYGVLLDLAG